MFQRIVLSVVVVGGLSVNLQSCSQNTNWQSLNTTQKGATAGGVLGAGLGAIIGSQTGDAGAGVAIGGLAGAGAGAMIGRSIDRVDVANQRHQEVIARQQAQLDSQRRELDELRQNGESTVKGPRTGYSRSGTSLPSGAFGSFNHRLTRGGPSGAGVVYATPEMIAEARARLRAPRSDSAHGVASQSDSALHNSDRSSDHSSEAFSTDIKIPESGRIVESAAIKENAGNQYDATQEITSPLETDPSFIDSPATTAVEATEKLDQVQHQASGGAAALAAADVAVPAAVTGEGKDCDRASDELAEARRKEESSDRLFHLRRADRLCPDRVDVAIELGRVYNKLGRTDDATFELNRALKLNPEAISAREELAKIGKN